MAESPPVVRFVFRVPQALSLSSEEASEGVKISWADWVGNSAADQVAKDAHRDASR